MPRTKIATTKSATPATAETIAESSTADGGTASRPATKAARLVALMEAPGGASLAEMGTALGWQAHTIRAALSGLRKTGQRIERQSRGGETVYGLQTDVAAATAAKSAPTTAHALMPADSATQDDGSVSPEAQS